MADTNLSRRALLEKFRPPSLEAQPSFVRPPQALSELHFLQLCTQCNQCISACPANAITLEHGYPVLSGRCDGCYQCVQACQSGALTHSALKAHVNFRCNPKLAQHCQSCIEVCTTQAISVAAGHAANVDTQLCSGCGECVSGCDFFAITLD